MTTESDQLVTAVASLRDLATGLEAVSGTFTKTDSYSMARQCKSNALVAREAAALLEKIIAADARRSAADAARAASRSRLTQKE